MPKPLPVLSLLVFVSPPCFFADTPDYSKESIVILHAATAVAFSEDGSRERQQSFSVRVQSEAAVRQWGIVGVNYRAGDETTKIDYVRVRKPNGSVIETPESSSLDVTTTIAQTAPSYSDLHQKQVPVKALSVGDTLEFSFHVSRKNIEAPGQFWLDEAFDSDSVVLDQTLEISFPKQKYVRVVSPKIAPESHDEGERRTYLWKYSQLVPSQPKDKNKSEPDAEDVPRVRITSFKSWREVGRWWSALASPEEAITPAIREKAKELTAGLTSDADKAHAIYNYVSTKFRYIAISFGVGHYRPHAADEVLANQYGDCKDKHTLLSSLLKASGIQAWPALIGLGIKLDEFIPSPGQFNHIITVLPQNGKYSWLDTTTEVAAFGVLVPPLRDERALVIPPSGEPLILKTPLTSPFPVSKTIHVNAALDAGGTLSGHFELVTNEDIVLFLRAAFRQLGPAQFQALAQPLSQVPGLSCDVGAVNVQNIEDIDKPIDYSCDYNQKNYFHWAENKIAFPLPPMNLSIPPEDTDIPREPFWIGAPGTYTCRATIKLPKGFTGRLPIDQWLTTEPSDYRAHYSLKNDGTVAVERTLLIKQAKATPDQWGDLQSLAGAIARDQSSPIVVWERGRQSPPN